MVSSHRRHDSRLAWQVSVAISLGWTASPMTRCGILSALTTHCHLPPAIFTHVSATRFRRVKATM